MSPVLWFAAGAVTMGAYSFAFDAVRWYRLWRLRRDIQACRWALRRKRIEIDRALRPQVNVLFPRPVSRDLRLLDNERWSRKAS